MESCNTINLYQKLFEHHYSIMMLIDPVNGDILEANNAAINYYGYTKEKLMNMKIQDINIYSEAEVKEEMNRAKEENRNYFQFIHRLANNEHKEVEVHSHPIEFDKKKLLYSIIHDVSQRVEQKLMLESLFFNSPYALVILDKNQKIVNINNNFSNMFKYSLNEVIGKTIGQLVSPYEYVNQIDNNVQLIYRGDIFKQEGERMRKDGKLIDVEILGYPVINQNQIIGVYIIYNDITHRKRLQQRDTLTGLYNRDYFRYLTNSFILTCKENNRKFALIILNLNHFKEINDSLGHEIGDKVLIEFTKRISSYKENSYLISRFSGDEFAILCDLETKEDIEHYVTQLSSKIRDSYVLESIILNVTTKIGISIYPENGLDAETLIRNADIAMYKARNFTEHKICFYTIEMSKEMGKRFLITNYLVQAISRNELTIYYQPIFDIEDQKNIVGLEALLRWKSPIVGGIPPGVFIPLAEKSGQIIPIGEWVLEGVCQQINLWEHKGHTIPVSINISVKQLEEIGFFQSVMKIMKQYNVEPHNIELEITESVSSGDLFTIINNLKELKKNGFKISMDDFGTGFSSLGQLDLFELDKLKIDKIFIDGLVNTSKKQNLVKTIIAMAKGLNLTVVAEGIETKEQLSYLKEIGCQLGQGYLVSKPLPVEEIDMLLDSVARYQSE